jgi:hypothetical protein
VYDVITITQAVETFGKQAVAEKLERLYGFALNRKS